MTPALSAHERKRFKELLKEAADDIRLEWAKAPAPDTDSEIREAAVTQFYDKRALAKLESKLTQKLNRKVKEEDDG